MYLVPISVGVLSSKGTLVSYLQKDLSAVDSHYMAANWCRVLVARNLVVGVKPSSLNNFLTIKPYHPKFLARQFGLNQQVSLPHDSLAPVPQRRKLLLMSSQ